MRGALQTLLCACVIALTGCVVVDVTLTPNDQGGFDGLVKPRIVLPGVFNTPAPAGTVVEPPPTPFALTPSPLPSVAVTFLFSTPTIEHTQPCTVSHARILPLNVRRTVWGVIIGNLAAHTPVRVLGSATDPTGRIWYRIDTPAGWIAGWLAVLSGC